MSAENEEFDYGFDEGIDPEELQSEREAGAWRWVHIPPTSPISLRVLVRRPLSWHGHYYSGQMWRCPREGCGLDEKQDKTGRKVGKQRRYCLAVEPGPGMNRALWEFGWQTAEDLEAILDSRGSLEGVVLDVRRDPPGKRQPVRLTARVIAGDEWSGSLPTINDFPALLARHLKTWAKGGQ